MSTFEDAFATASDKGTYEGLDLLAAFRSIRDENVRRALILLIATLANAEQEPSTS